MLILFKRHLLAKGHPTVQKAQVASKIRMKTMKKNPRVSFSVLSPKNFNSHVTFLWEN